DAALGASQEAYGAASAQLQARLRVLSDLAPWEDEMSRLNRNRDIAQSSYTMLSDRLRDLEIRFRARVPTSRVIERATFPVSPVRPRKRLQVALCGVLGLLLGVGLVFF